MPTSKVASERDKYERIWGFQQYRSSSPGARAVARFLAVARPEDGQSVADCGCGSGRAGAKLAEAGLKVVLVDFASNCRDPDPAVQALTFVEADLSQHIPVQADYVFCADVLEHIPPDEVDAVLTNLFACAPRAFLKISKVDDCCGALIGERLHLSVHPHDWWREKVAAFGRVSWEEEARTTSTFYVMRQ